MAVLTHGNHKEAKLIHLQHIGTHDLLVVLDARKVPRIRPTRPLACHRVLERPKVPAEGIEVMRTWISEAATLTDHLTHVMEDPIEP